MNRHDREKNKQLNFIDFGLVIKEYKLFKELFQQIETKQPRNKKDYVNCKALFSITNVDNDIRNEMTLTKEKEKRRKKEIDFYEQFWLIINPENNEFVKVELVVEVFKILYNPLVSPTKEIVNELKQFLQAEFFLNENIDENKTYLSPITGQEISETDVWDEEKLIKEFMELRENVLAYQEIHNLKDKLVRDLENMNVRIFELPYFREKKHTCRITSQIR